MVTEYEYEFDEREETSGACRSRISVCGLICGNCHQGVDSGGTCRGCRESKGEVYWVRVDGPFKGIIRCPVFRCCVEGREREAPIERGTEDTYEHCGLCPRFPCKKYLELGVCWSPGDPDIERKREEAVQRLLKAADMKKMERGD